MRLQGISGLGCESDSVPHSFGLAQGLVALGLPHVDGPYILAVVHFHPRLHVESKCVETEMKKTHGTATGLH